MRLKMVVQVFVVVMDQTHQLIQPHLEKSHPHYSTAKTHEIPGTPFGQAKNFSNSEVSLFQGMNCSQKSNLGGVIILQDVLIPLGCYSPVSNTKRDNSLKNQQTQISYGLRPQQTKYGVRGNSRKVACSGKIES
jgi:hypothetical protein